MSRDRMIATICARGGSKGLPGKNIRPFMGKPLIAHAVELAKQVEGIGGVFVSTDSAEIAQAAQAHGAQFLGFRPAELATDAAPKLPALLHLVQQVESQLGPVDWVLDLQPTSPLTTLRDLRACMEAADLEPRAGLIATSFESGSNPYYTMVELDSCGLASLSKPAQFARRQDAPSVETLNGAAYLWRRDALAHAAQNGLWSVAVRTVRMPKERSFDIDDATDFALAEFMAQRLSSQPESP